MEQNLNKTCRQLAEEHYDTVGENFHFQLEQHHEANNGWVIDVPYAFGMGYFYKDDNDDVVLYVTYVNGEMGRLFRLGLNFEVDKIEFRRNFKERVHRYDFNKFLSRIV